MDETLACGQCRDELQGRQIAMVEYDYVKTRRENVQPIKDSQVPAVRFIMRWITRLHVAVFRLSKGRLMNRFIGGYPVAS